MKDASFQPLGACPHKFYSADRSFESYLGFCEGSDFIMEKSAIINLQKLHKRVRKQGMGSVNTMGKRDGGKCSAVEQGGHEEIIVGVVRMNEERR